MKRLLQYIAISVLCAVSSLPATAGTAVSQLKKYNVSGDAQKYTFPQKEKYLTVLVFVNGKNDLEKYAVEDINELEKVGSTDKVNFVVEAGRASFDADWDDQSDNDWTGTKRFYIVKDDNPGRITSPIIESTSSADMGSVDSVAAFLAWGKKNYPAKKYILVLWDHGSGWLDTEPVQFPTKPQGDRAILSDFEKGTHVNSVDLVKIFEKAGSVNVLAMDACLMQTIEVAYSLRKYVPVVAASEELEPGDGYNYTYFAQNLIKTATATDAKMGAAIVNAFAKGYQGSDDSRTHSAVKTAALGSVLNQIVTLEKAILSAVEKNPETLEQLKYALMTSFRFRVSGFNETSILSSLENSTNGDLYNLASKISFWVQDKKVSEAAFWLQERIRNAVIANTVGGSTYIITAYQKPGPMIANKWDFELEETKYNIGNIVKGLAVRIPAMNGRTPDATTPYESYEFEQRTKWGKFWQYITAKIGQYETKNKIPNPIVNITGKKDPMKKSRVNSSDMIRPK
ncbi:MAG: clostripain-related cysteine peptidase [Elusimicrobiaceae bacterium]|jgi:hypothetical protein